MTAVADLRAGDVVVAVNGLVLPASRTVEYVDGNGWAWLLAEPGQATEHVLYPDQHEVTIERLVRDAGSAPVDEPALPGALVAVEDRIVRERGSDAGQPVAPIGRPSWATGKGSRLPDGPARRWGQQHGLQGNRGGFLSVTLYTPLPVPCQHVLGPGGSGWVSRRGSTGKPVAVQGWGSFARVALIPLGIIDEYDGRYYLTGRGCSKCSR